MNDDNLGREEQLIQELARLRQRVAELEHAECERQHVEEALRKSEERRWHAQRLTRVGYWDWSVETNELLWSEEVFDIFGQDLQTFRPSVESFEASIHPDDLQRFVDERNRALADPTADSLDIEHRIVWPDGTVHHVHEICEIRRDERGAVSHVTGAVQDITRRKQAEEALREKTEEMDRFFSSALDLLCIADTDGYFRRLNREWERVLGYRLEDLEGRRFLDLVHPDDVQATLAAIADLDTQKEVLNFTNRYLCQDGLYCWIEWRSVPHGKLIYAAARDITMRKRTEEQLQRYTLQLEALHDVGLEMSGQLALEPLLQVVVARAVQLLEGTSGGLYLYRPECDALEYVLEIDNPAMAGTWLRRGEGVGGRVLATNSTVLVSDYQHWEGRAAAFAGGSYRAVVGAPIHWGGEFLGVLVVDHATVGAFSPADARLLEIFASQAAGAIRNAQLYGDLQQQAATLRESESKFRQLVENIEEVFWIRDLNAGQLVYLSPSYERIWGRPLEGALRNPGTFLQAVHPEDVVTVAELYRASLERPVRVEYRIVLPNVSERWVEVRTFLAGEETGQRWQVGVAADITARKEAERALQESEAKFRMIAESSAEDIWQLDVHGHVIYASPAVERIFGYTPLEALKLDFAAFFPTSELDKAKDAFARAISDQKHQLLEFVGKRKDGSLLPIEVSVTPILRGNSIAGVQGIARDITQRRQAEDALRESEQRLRLAHKATRDVVWDWDIVHDAQRWNEAGAAVFGWTDIVEHPQTATWWIERVHSDDRQRVDEGFFAVVENPECDYWRDEYRFRKADGSYAEVMDRGYVLRNAQGRAVRMIGAMLDITERKQAEQALRRSNEDLQHFAYAVSHDLQEPLRMVSSYVQLLQKRYAGRLDPDADEFIGYAVEGAQRMSAMIYGILDYSRVNTQGQEMAPTDCEALLQRALSVHQLAVEDSDATVTHDPLPTVLADATQLGRVFQNLLSNALKFHAQQPPRVHVSARQEGGEWLFSMQDNGIGIDPQYAGQLFQVFRRLHSRAEYPGTGIGLAMCRRIVERHGGQIWVDSQPGEGSTFYFTLPAQ